MDERQHKQLADLLDKFQAGTCTPEEQRMLDEAFLRMGLQEGKLRSDADFERLKEIAWQPIAAQTFRRTRLRKLAWLPYAAAVLVAATVGIWLFFANPFHTPTTLDPAEIAPGGNRATLTLADGQVIDLSETQTGIVIGEQDITYSDGASLGLSPAGGGRGRLDAIEELVLSTPKGGTYQVTLPDGSRVWLNSASSLTYPSRFDDNERVVELTGEAYFEVVHYEAEGGAMSPFGGGRDGLSDGRGRKLPFLVKSNGQTVEVLGTQFNITAYPDEPVVKTTLVEGSVRLEANGASLQLVPGEQAINTGQQLTKQEVDLYTVTAWQQGDFRFAEDLESIMKQVARWYDIEINFKDESLKQESVLAYVKRNRPLSEILTILQESTGAKFAVRGSDQRKEVVIMR